MKKYNIGYSLQLAAIHFQKEIRAITRDSGALLILIGAMIIYPVVYSVGYFKETLTDLPVAVVDQDGTKLSRKYANMADASKELHVAFNPADLPEAEALFFQDRIKGVILIPKGFQEAVSYNFV